MSPFANFPVETVINKSADLIYNHGPDVARNVMGFSAAGRPAEHMEAHSKMQCRLETVRLTNDEIRRSLPPNSALLPCATANFDYLVESIYDQAIALAEEAGRAEKPKKIKERFAHLWSRLVLGVKTTALTLKREALPRLIDAWPTIAKEMKAAAPGGPQSLVVAAVVNIGKALLPCVKNAMGVVLNEPNAPLDAICQMLDEQARLVAQAPPSPMRERASAEIARTREAIRARRRRTRKATTFDLIGELVTAFTGDGYDEYDDYDEDAIQIDYSDVTLKQCVVAGAAAGLITAVTVVGGAFRRLMNLF